MLPQSRLLVLLVVATLVVATVSQVGAQTSDPATSYIYPAGAQRGQTVDVRVGGLFLLTDSWFEILGTDVESTGRLRSGETVWFEGPQLTGARSLQADEYPQDHVTQIHVHGDATPGVRYWRAWTAQGACAARPFVIGDLPEHTEQEIDGAPVATQVETPITINGRIFPRADVDVWKFYPEAGETYTIEVLAKEIRSPLETRIVLQSQGAVIREDIGSQISDPNLVFVAQHDGEHEIHIHDLGFAGSQAHVYRLSIRRGTRANWVFPLGGHRGQDIDLEVGIAPTLIGEPITVKKTRVDGKTDAAFVRKRLQFDNVTTQPIKLALGDLPEIIEIESPSQHTPITDPTTINGRIQTAGDVDDWPIQAKANTKVELRFRAASLGSALMPVMELLDPGGKLISPTEAIPIQENSPSADYYLTFVPSDDGIYTVRVRDRFPTRGGPEFGYRLQVGTASPGFRLSFASDITKVEAGGELSLPIRVERQGTFDAPIQLEIEGLPPHATAECPLVASDATEANIKVVTTSATPVGGYRLKIRGVHTAQDGKFQDTAVLAPSQNDAPLDSTLLAVTIGTPFTFKNLGPYYVNVPAGSVYWHPFAVIRNGYEGPITVSIADRQRRHLQGVIAAHPIVVPAGVDRFEFPFYLPPDMSINRLGRPLVMAVAEIEDEQGKRHVVAYTNGEEAQAPIRSMAARLSLVTDQTSLILHPNHETELAFQVLKDANLHQPTRVELIVPRHIEGIEAEVITLEPDQNRSVMAIRAGSTVGPLNMPVLLRATILEKGDPIVAETEVTLVFSDSHL